MQIIICDEDAIYKAFNNKFEKKCVCHFPDLGNEFFSLLFFKLNKNLSNLWKLTPIYHNASVGAAAIDQKEHLGMKRCWKVT